MIICAFTLIQDKMHARRSRLLTVVLINIFIELIYIKVIFSAIREKWFLEWLANCNTHDSSHQVYSSTFKQSQLKINAVSQNKSMYYETWNCIMFKVFCVQYIVVQWKGTPVLYLFRWLFYSLDGGNLFIDFWIPDCQEDIRYLADVKNSWTLYMNLIVCLFKNHSWIAS